MSDFLKSISYIFHPLFMPLLGSTFFFSKSPRYLPVEIIEEKLFSIGLLTIILPILLYLLLKTLKKVHSVNLPTTKERILPLALNCVIIFLVIERILPKNELLELYCFFIGILLSTLACLILAILQFKISIHMIAAGGVLMFIIGTSIHYQININGSIMLMCVISGLIATSRLHMRAHNNIELLIGFFIGIIPQIILLNYWL
ncbi:hypothetical protein [Pontimicrobium aquaticum]|uniref:Transmembrane protein n=1 Tax=Pontimicrobium aquaticum TaxID=2565367 RepID=A0A4U0ESB9_9FLAO|nr:hypothetical protein [Pontimicrobium aquaticum]TJY34600.1 hypothetical protein E5167_09810 [Pontimicrobium aquaticum]